MNIKEAKQELLQTIQVYTRKDSNGHYLLPSVRQRPILLIGPPAGSLLPPEILLNTINLPENLILSLWTA